MPKLAVVPPVSPPDSPLMAALARVPGVHEVLLGHEQMARWGGFPTETLIEHARQARSSRLRTVLVWDLLAKDRDIADSGALLHRLSRNLFDAVRVSDPGIAAYLRERFPDWPQQLVLESGNHNLTGLKTWTERLGPERIAVSNEIPMGQLALMRSNLSTQVEILGLGRLLIFMTPRKLLSPIQRAEAAADAIQQTLHNEEDGKNFPFIENSHGTFMFYEKELFLLPYLAEIRAAGVDVVRLDLSHLSPQPVIQCLADFLRNPVQTAEKALRQCLGPKLTRGFFKSNRTDKQFRKLRNPHLLIDDARDYIGKVVETRKKGYLALETRTTFEVGETLHIVVPEGGEKVHRVAWIKDSAQREQSRAACPGLWLINPGRGISSGSLVYREPAAQG